MPVPVDNRITDLNPATVLDGFDQIPIVQNTGTFPITRSLQFSVLLAHLDWIRSSATWSYSSADSPTFVVSVNVDMTGMISPGMRVRLLQTTTKYFIVTAVGSYSGGATLITLYGGTDYTLANAAISDPCYSPAKAPFGFPTNPAKWTVEVKYSSDAIQSSPVANTWYNLGSVSISIPIGAWRVLWQGHFAVDSTGQLFNIYMTLSTANNSESDNEFTSLIGAIYPSAYTTARVQQNSSHEKHVLLASKTTYYLLERSTLTVSALAIYGSSGNPARITAVCAYL